VIDRTALRRRARPALRRGLARVKRTVRPVETAFPSQTPVSRRFGFDRGQPIDRHYIDRFLEANRGDIRGRTIEVADDAYTRRFGGPGVDASVLHVDVEAPGATLIGDLATGEGIPEAAFDCAIVTQTLPFVYDVRAAVANIHRLLAPGGVALVTLSGISQISRFDMDRWGDFWRFTDLSARRLFEEVFPQDEVAISAYGNVFAASALLYGLAVEDTGTAALDPADRDYQVTLGVRAVRR
jgi:SAM-dependent methyltransferase